jgi:diguanylate cyclase (GGDEF)-like protein
VSDTSSQQLFSFSKETDETAGLPAPARKDAVERLSQVVANRELEDIHRAVVSAGEAAYHWIVESDAISWSVNSADVLGCDIAELNSGRAFAQMLDADNFTSRYDTVMRSKARDDGAGVPFQIEYLFRPQGDVGRQAIWLEDCGRWFAGSDGRPAEVYGIVRRIDDRHRRDRHLSFLGNCDPLTGMMNRRRMEEALGEAIDVSDRNTLSCAFAVAAINNLAVVSYAYGFEIADEVIVAVGRRLRQVMRTGDALARYSGSKFGIILNHCSEEELRIAAERLLNVARESVIETARGPVWAMLSIGGVILPRHASEANTAMARAEEALTEAKKLPSDGFVLFRPSAQRVSERDLNARCATEIVACLKQNRFQLAYQPIIDARSGAVVMHEALLRMADFDGAMIAAAHLVPIAEKLGLVRLIDRNVMQLAVGVLLEYPQARLALNVSGITATDPRWHGQLIEMLAAHRELAGRLTIEINEAAALADVAETARFTRALHEAGCGVAIDDFGASVSSFRSLKVLEPDFLKIDGSFSERLASNSDNQYFIRSLIEMAEKFGIKTIAEWVQTEEDADYLRQWGVDYLQGNLFGSASMALPWMTPEREAEVPEQLPVSAGPVHAPPLQPNLDRQGLDLTRLREAIATLDEHFHRPAEEKPTQQARFADILGGSKNLPSA